MQTVQNLFSFVIAISAAIYGFTFLNRQQIGWAVACFLGGFAAFAMIQDLGGVRDALGNFMATVLKAIAEDAEQA